MYTYPVVAVLLAGTAFAAPNHAARDMPSAAESASPSVTATCTASSIESPTASSTTTFTTTVVVWPTPAPKPTAGVYICSDPEWAGDCTHYLRPIGGSPEDCTVLDGTASSIGPDQGFMCFFFENAFCYSILSDSSDMLALVYPGVSDLSTMSGGSWNDRVRSYICFDDGSGTA